MTKVYLLGITVLVVIIGIVTNLDDDKMNATSIKVIEPTKTATQESVDKEESKTVQTKPIKNKQEKIVEHNQQKEVKVVSVDKTANQSKPTPKKEPIVSYQKVYEYIKENDLKPMFEEPKKDKDGNEYNIYYKEPVKSSSSAMLPPMLPNLVNISGTMVAVPNGVQNVSKSIKTSDGETRLENYDITEDGAKQDEDVVIFSTPPQIGQNL
jgi:DNA-binding protein H-NS